MEQDLKARLIQLADKYETPAFLEKDPSQFMHKVSDPKEQELIGFFAANIAFGRRDQILKHIDIVLQKSGEKFSRWIQEEKYKNLFTLGEKSFYRVYSHNSMVSFFDTIKKMLNLFPTFGNCIYTLVQQNNNPVSTICNLFPKDCTLIPKGKDSSCKKVNMFLRWMVRDNSPVDLGLWSSWLNKKNLLIPLDTHVLQESVRLGLIASSATGKLPSGNMKTCIKITEAAREIFPEDPARLDFSLFGLGVDKGI